MQILLIFYIIAVKKYSPRAEIFRSFFCSRATVDKFIVCNHNALDAVCKNRRILQIQKTVTGNGNISVDTAAAFKVIAATTVTNPHCNTGAASNPEAQTVAAEHIVADSHLFAGAHLAPACHIAGDLYCLMRDIAKIAAFQQHFTGLEEDASGSGSLDTAGSHQCIGTERSICQHIAGPQIAVYIRNIHAIDFITGYSEGTLLPEVILPIDSDHIAGLRPISRHR